MVNPYNGWAPWYGAKAVEAAGYGTICWTTSKNDDPAGSAANAALIVRAVNSHEALVEALSALVEKLDLVHDDPRYEAVWTISQLHAGPYTGPQYDKELEAGRLALSLARGEQTP